jgi:hypothetical protein
LKFYFDSDTSAVFLFDLIKKNLSRFQKMIMSFQICSKLLKWRFLSFSNFGEFFLIQHSWIYFSCWFYNFFLKRKLPKWRFLFWENSKRERTKKWGWWSVQEFWNFINFGIIWNRKVWMEIFFRLKFKRMSPFFFHSI